MQKENTRVFESRLKTSRASNLRCRGGLPRADRVAHDPSVQANA